MVLVNTRSMTTISKNPQRHRRASRSWASRRRKISSSPRRFHSPSPTADQVSSCSSLPPLNSLPSLPSLPSPLLQLSLASFMLLLLSAPSSASPSSSSQHRNLYAASRDSLPPPAPATSFLKSTRSTRRNARQTLPSSVIDPRSEHASTASM